jgi:hypothetical protein
LSGVEGHGVDNGWLVSRVANGEVAITFFDFVIEEKRTLHHHLNFPE